MLELHHWTDFVYSNKLSAENWNKWHLMPKDFNIATLEIVREALGQLSII